MVEKKNSFYGFVISLLCVVTTLVFCTPILGIPIYYVVIGGLIASFLVINSHRPIIKRNKTYLILFILYAAISVFYRIIGQSDNAWGNSMHEFSFLLAFGLTLLQIDKGTEKQQKWVYWIIIGIMAANIADNILLSILFPSLREYRYVIDESVLATLNAGDSTFYTFSLFFFNICFFVYLNTLMRSVKRLMFFMMVLSAVFILVYSHKGSVVIYLILSFILQLFAFRSKRTGKFISLAVLFSLLIVVTINYFSKEIADLVKALVPSERLSERLITIIDVNDSYANEETVVGRTELYMLSLKTWLSNPVNFLIGVGDVRDMKNIYAYGVGLHADLFDTLARFGILGGCIMFICLKRIFSYIFSRFDKSLKLQLSVIAMIFVICGCSKNVFSPEIGASLFILFPLSSRYVHKKN